MNLRSPSLFVTFAVSFLVVLVLGTVLQALSIVGIVRPMMRRAQTARAELAMERAAVEVAPAVRDRNGMEAMRILRTWNAAEEDFWLMVRDPEGQPFVGPPGRGGLERGRRGGRRPPAMRPEDILASQPIQIDGEAVGEIVALARGPLPGAFRWRDRAGGGWGPLLFLPLAILIAGTAALLLFRSVIRRIRSLESLATRIAEGDLTARVEEVGKDEIGRLGWELNRMATRLAEAQEHLEQSEHQRKQLFADITHELNTPLTSIRGYAQTLLDSSVEVTEKETESYLENVHTEAKRMDLLLSDLLELTRLEAGAPLQRETIDWTALCRNTVERFTPRFAKADIRLTCHAEDTARHVHADGRRLEQILDNLLMNALRYVPTGSQVEVGFEPEASDMHRLMVRDHGSGFPEDELNRVFDRFYRGTTSVGGAGDEGSGLGLAIVQEIAHRHGGWARASNHPGGGACLEIALPDSDRAT